MFSKLVRCSWFCRFGFVGCVFISQIGFCSAPNQDEIRRATEIELKKAKQDFLEWLKSTSVDGFHNSKDTEHKSDYSLTHVVFSDEDVRDKLQKKTGQKNDAQKVYNTFLVFNSENNTRSMTDNAKRTILKEKMRELFNEDAVIRISDSTHSYAVGNCYVIKSRPIQSGDGISAKIVASGDDDLKDLSEGCIQVVFWIYRCNSRSSVQIIEVRAAK